ncbi:hypothetical protein CEP53_004050 [Fusarium sp. AF-6]|nr:hypothetical protein CEP53_004050 [Fusarium sp. AF-6]
MCTGITTRGESKAAACSALYRGGVWVVVVSLDKSRATLSVAVLECDSSQWLGCERSVIRELLYDLSESLLRLKTLRKWCFISSILRLEGR